jgi:hypothetical protein
MPRARSYDPLTHRYLRSVDEMDDRPSRLLTSAFEQEEEERQLRAQLDPAETDGVSLGAQAVIAGVVIAALVCVYWLVRG